MIAIVGESASGKTSIKKCLIEKYGLKDLITYTTREPRKDEKNGIDYHFVGDFWFTIQKKQSFFAETAEYNGWQYGTALKDCTDDKVVIVTPRGLRNLKKIKNLNIVSFYINIPRRDRLIKILQRGDNIEESYRRNLSDVGQFDGIEDEVDIVINNEGYKKSVTQIAEEIIKCCDTLSKIKEKVGIV